MPLRITQKGDFASPLVLFSVFLKKKQGCLATDRLHSIVFNAEVCATLWLWKEPACGG